MSPFLAPTVLEGSSTGLTTVPTFPVSAAPCVPFDDQFLRPDGPLGNGWTVISNTGTTVNIVSHEVVASGGTGPDYVVNVLRILSDMPTYVEVNVSAITLGFAHGSTVLLLCGIGPIAGPFSGVVFTMDGINNWHIFSIINGVQTLRASASALSGAFRLRLRRELNASVWTYIGSYDGNDVVSWADTGGVAKWGTTVGVVIDAIHPSGGVADVPRFNEYDSDGCT